MGEVLGAEVLEPESSTSMETICLPGTIARPSILGPSSSCVELIKHSSLRYSSQVPRMTLASLSVHKNIPIKTRPSVSLIFMFLFRKLLSNLLP